jgi:hypothetical protein
MKQWTNIDKSRWGDGPWQNEPDKKQWVDAATGLDCLIVRNAHLGNWCGYVGVPQNHPLFGKDYGAVDVDVHGGLTFSEKCEPDPRGEGYGICHTPEPGRSEVYWFGFDCGHAFDLAPAMEAYYKKHYISSLTLDESSVYRDMTYVEEECTRLARQLAQP